MASNVDAVREERLRRRRECERVRRERETNEERQARFVNLSLPLVFSHFGNDTL